MNLEQYRIEAKRTCPDLGSFEKNLLHMRLGIITEVGETLDIFKKKLAYNKEVDLVHLGEELADICWYVVNLATFNGKDITKTQIWEIDNLSHIELLANIDSNMESEEWNEHTVIEVIKIICKDYNLHLEQILENNINKLKVRYPDKFTTENALNRNLEAERKELEK